MKYSVSLAQSIQAPTSSAPKPIKSKGTGGAGKHERKRSKHVRFSGIGSHTRSNALVPQKMNIPELDPKRDSLPLPAPQRRKMHQRIMLSKIAENEEQKNYIIRITSASLNEFEFSTFTEEALQRRNSDATSDEDEESCSSAESTSSETSSTESTVSSSDHEFDDTEDDLERCQILHLP